MYSRPEPSRASRKGSSVVPGLPKRCVTPAARSIDMRAVATFTTGSPIRRPRGAYGRTGLHVLRIHEAADLRGALALRREPHHVTRDVQAEGSGGGMARVGDLRGRLRLDVAGAVGAVAEIRATAGAGHPLQNVAALRGERVERALVRALGKDGPR